MLNRNNIKNQAVLEPQIAKKRLSRKNRVKGKNKYTSKNTKNVIYKPS